MNKMITTLNLSAPSRNEEPRLAQWEETRSVFPIYLALAKQLAIDIPIPQAKRNLPEKPEAELFTQVQEWLDAMDQRVLVHELRHLLQMTTLNASESGLRALIRRHLRKPTKNHVDRDKIDFLLVQYFALCAPAKIYHKQIEPADVALVMKPVLGDAPAPAAPLAWCEPLEKMIMQLRELRSLGAMTKTDFIAQGRKVKEAAGTSFYETSALLAFIRFNFLLRRTLIELMHADLIAIRAALHAAGFRRNRANRLHACRARCRGITCQKSSKWQTTGSSHFRRNTRNVRLTRPLRNCWGCEPTWTRRSSKLQGKPAS